MLITIALLSGHTLHPVSHGLDTTLVVTLHLLRLEFLRTHFILVSANIIAKL